MKYAHPLLAFLLLFISACTTTAPFNHPNASGHYSSDIEQCSLYARRLTGVKLYGDAGDWWTQAQGRYRRGQTPLPGAILVLKKTSHLRSGHVAVVKNVLGPREINVTQSNWGDSRSARHIIYESQLARDVSPGNDWTSVRFWNDAKNAPGFPYAAYGFIYP